MSATPRAVRQLAPLIQRPPRSGCEVAIAPKPALRPTGRMSFAAWSGCDTTTASNRSNTSSRRTGRSVRQWRITSPIDVTVELAARATWNVRSRVLATVRRLYRHSRNTKIICYCIYFGPTLNRAARDRINSVTPLASLAKILKRQPRPLVEEMALPDRDTGRRVEDRTRCDRPKHQHFQSCTPDTTRAPGYAKGSVGTPSGSNRCADDGRMFSRIEQ